MQAKPEELMEKGEAHWVSLSVQALDVPREVRSEELRGIGLVFPNSPSGAMLPTRLGRRRRATRGSRCRPSRT